MLTAMLYDDEKPALSILKRMLEKTGMVRVTSVWQRSAPFLEEAGRCRPDVAFLDIESAEKNGLDIARELNALSPGTDIVFVTAYRQYAVDAFDISAADYLLKPLQAARLRRTVERLAARRNAQSSSETQNKVFTLRCTETFALLDENGEAMRWPTQKTAELAAFLWLYRERVMDVPLLTENIWPTLDAVRARNNLYTTVYNLKHAFAAFCGRTVRIEKRSGGYQLCTTLKSDTDQIKELLEQMDSAPQQEKLILFHKVMKLYTGALFESGGYLWAQSAQAFLQTEIEKRGIRLAARLMRENLLQDAQDVLQLLILRDHCFETAYLFLVRLYNRLPDASSAQLTYARYCNIMREELGVEPRSFAEIIFDRKGTDPREGNLPEN